MTQPQEGHRRTSESGEPAPKNALRWLVIGTGGIAGDFATSLRDRPFGRVTRVLGSAPGRGAAFARRVGLQPDIEVASLSQGLACDEVDAVYVASPHPMHEAAALAAIEAGKPVLVEKPIGLNAASAERIVRAAKARGVFLMEAYMYRCHPLIATLLERIDAGAIGRITHVDAKFCFAAPFDPKHRLFNPDLGGGAILDIGGYTMSFACLIAGRAQGVRYAEPIEMTASGVLGATGVEELARARLLFDGGMQADLTCAVSHDLGTETIIRGERGRIVLPDPWIPGGDRHQRHSGFRVHIDGARVEDVSCPANGSVYALEAELVAGLAETSLEPAFPAMNWDDTLRNMRLLDRWRALVHA